MADELRLTYVHAQRIANWLKVHKNIHIKNPIVVLGALTISEVSKKIQDDYEITMTEAQVKEAARIEQA